jgi:hypothetical protein
MKLRYRAWCVPVPGAAKEEGRWLSGNNRRKAHSIVAGGDEDFSL